MAKKADAESAELSSSRSLQLPVEIMHRRDAKDRPLVKRILYAVTVNVAGLLLTSLLAAFPFVLGWDDNPDKRDYGALTVAFVIEAVGVLILIVVFIKSRKKKPVLTITKDGLIRHRRRTEVLFGAGAWPPEVFIKWNDIASLEARQETHSSLVMGMPVGKQVTPLRYIWIFPRNSQSPPVVCDMMDLDRKPAEIFQILNACFKTLGGNPSAASPPDLLNASSMNTIPKGPIEIRFGLRRAMVQLVLAPINGFLGGGLVWFGMCSVHGLLSGFSNTDIKSMLVVVFGLIMLLICIYCLYHGGRGFLIRSPQLIIGEHSLTYRRLALSIPWREIDPDQLKFSVSRTFYYSVASVDAALIRVTFHGATGSRTSVRSPVVLDVSRMDRTPEDIYYLIKARALPTKLPPLNMRN